MYELRYLDELISIEALKERITKFHNRFSDIDDSGVDFKDLIRSDDPICYSYEQYLYPDNVDIVNFVEGWYKFNYCFDDLLFEEFKEWSRSTYLLDVKKYIDSGNDTSLLVFSIKRHYLLAKESSNEYPICLKCMDDFVDFTCSSFPNHFQIDDFNLKELKIVLKPTCIPFLTKLYYHDFDNGIRLTNSRLEHLVRLLTSGINTDGPIIFNIQSIQVAFVFQLLSTHEFLNGSRSKFFSAIEDSELFLSSYRRPFSKKALEKVESFQLDFSSRLKNLSMD